MDRGEATDALGPSQPSEASRPEPEEQPAEQGLPIRHIQLRRITDRIIHNGPDSRYREREYLIDNSTDEEFPYLYLPLRRLVWNPVLRDEDGRKLAVLPNKVYKDVMAKLRENDPEAADRMAQRFAHVDWVMLVHFPKEAPLKAKSSRTLTLSFRDKDPVATTGFRHGAKHVGRLGRFKGTAFSIPEFSFDGEQVPGHDYDHVWSICAPPGYVLIGQETMNGSVNDGMYHVNDLEERSPVASLLFKPAEGREYSWQVRYELVPSSTTRVNGLLTLLLITWLVGVPLLLGSLSAETIPVATKVASWLLNAPYLGGVYDAFASALPAFGASLIAVSAAILFSVNEPWMDRYDYLLGLGVFVNALGLAIRQLPITG